MALTAQTVPADRPWSRVYALKHGYDTFNPGRGRSRFAPFEDPAGAPVATAYLGESDLVALLETVFHDVSAGSADRKIWERDLLERALITVQAPHELVLLDLRDGALPAVGLRREQLVTTSAAHYRCTTEWSRWAHTTHPDVDGLLWHSRVAELAFGAQGEAAILFGDRIGDAAGAFPVAAPGVRSLFEGPGRLDIDELAELVDAEIVPVSE